MWLNTLLQQLKPGSGKRFRMVRMDPENFPLKTARGWKPVMADSEAVKGTTLEQFKNTSGQVQIGNSVLSEVSEERAKELEKVIQDKNEARQRAIEKAYMTAGEDIKRRMGSGHKHMKFFVEKDGDRTEESD